MNIKEIRAKYPQYSDMSDADLASALHKKFYAEMPFDQFSAKIGLASKAAPVDPSQAIGEAQTIPEARYMGMDFKGEYGNGFSPAAAIIGTGRLADRPNQGVDAAKTAANFAVQRLIPGMDGGQKALDALMAQAAFAVDDPPAAVRLAVECSRTTHQSPIVLDACRCFAPLLVGALRGEQPAALFSGTYEPAPGFWKTKPLKPEFTSALASASVPPGPRQRGPSADVVHALANVRAAVAAADGIEDAVQRAIRAGREPAVDGALAGALGGALWGAGRGLL